MKLIKVLVAVSVIVLAVVIASDYINHQKTAISSAQSAEPSLSDTQVVEKATSDGGTTVVVGADPTMVTSQKFSPPSSDTNEVAKIVAQDAAKARDVRKAYDEAMRMNVINATKPSGPGGPQ